MLGDGHGDLCTSTNVAIKKPLIAGYRFKHSGSERWTKGHVEPDGPAIVS